MERRDFLKTAAAGIAGMGIVGCSPRRGMRTGTLSALDELSNLPTAERLPALFVGHGSPMNAIEDNAFSRTWKQLGKELPAPQAILCVSAHWLTRGETRVTAMEKPRTIHDFGGFPQALFDQQYPAPGSPDLARDTIEIVKKTHVLKDSQWGLDHGTWSVLLPMFPKAEIPVVQLSIDYAKPPKYHFELAKELRKLREKGVLIVGSGNLVHNLREMRRTSEPHDYTVEFESAMRTAIDAREFEKVVNFSDLGELAKKAHPTPDHFYPLLYTLGVVEDGEPITAFNEAFDLASISMTSFTVGGKVAPEEDAGETTESGGSAKG